MISLLVPVLLLLLFGGLVYFLVPMLKLPSNVQMLVLVILTVVFLLFFVNIILGGGLDLSVGMSKI